ncbi:Flp pilus assembly protein CpaB [bacterium]|nr:Flp pilus assembly protein CpaB [bacterium]
MNQSKAFLVSVVFALIGMALVMVYVSQERAAVEKEFGNKRMVVVAKRDINEMRMIEEDSLTVASIPSKFVQPGAIIVPPKENGGEQKAFYDVAGKVALSPLRKGEQILSTKIISRGPQTGLSSQVGLSKRALSIAIDEETGVTKLLKPGDRVDVIAKIDYNQADGRASEVKTLLQNVHVLAVGELVQNNSPTVFEQDAITGEYKSINLRADRSFATVTVEVTPAQAQVLIYTQETSRLFLTLRNPVDQLPANLSTINVDEVLGENSKKAIADRLARQVRTPAAVRPAPPPPKNPWLQGGGTLVK